MQLSARLLALVPERAHDAAGVASRLAAGLAEAHARWPAVRVDDERVAAWIAARVPADATALEDALDGLRLPELYLACACAAGDPHALAAFDAAYLAHDARTSDDVKQLLRQRLFVGDAPKIATYGGRGDLGSWVRTVATRLAIDTARTEREVPTEDALLEAIEIDPTRGPAYDVLKAEARQCMQTALREALAALSARERTLLLQYYIDGVGVAELGKVHGLAASNISRQLAKARVTLLGQVKRSMMRQKQLAGAELDSLIDLVRSQLTVTGGLRG